MFINRYRPERTYFKWGLKELQRRIEDMCECGYDEYDVINMFIHEMENYACMAKNPQSSFMFSTAADAGRYVLDGVVRHYI